MEEGRDEMRSIPLDELPQWSPWPARILGLEPWEAIERTPEKITEEYDSDKYAKCLEYVKRNQCSVVDVRNFERGNDLAKKICVSYRNELKEHTTYLAQCAMTDLIWESLGDTIENCANVVELGCGYGFNLEIISSRYPNPKYFGGEYSKNAVELAQSIHKHTVVEFDFLDPNSYSFLDNLDGPITVFTCHAIEQLPTVKPVLDALSKRKDKIKDVFHFEPSTYKTESAGLLGMLRRRYIELNGYNQDLLSEIVQRNDIEIVSHDLNVFGMNPLNPTSVVHWRFK